MCHPLQERRYHLENVFRVQTETLGGTNGQPFFIQQALAGNNGCRQPQQDIFDYRVSPL